MNGGPRIISLGPAKAESMTERTGMSDPLAATGLTLPEPREAASGTGRDAEPVTTEPDAAFESRDDDDDGYAAAPAGQLRRRLPLVLAALAVAGWSGFFIWANLPAMRQPASAVQWAGWIGAWSQPVIVVLVAALLVLRGSTREAARFGQVARSLADETDRLESRLASTNTELALARDFIAAQARDLEALGRVATERLSGSASQLRDLIAGNGAQVDRIGEVAGHALDNMEKLRGQLPVVANSVRDVTNAIGTAGRSAHLQLEDLIAGMQRLNEFGLASERQVGTVRDAVDEALALFEDAALRITELSDDRFGALDRAVDAHRARLDEEEAAALAALRARSDALGRELDERQQAIIAAGETAVTGLHARIDRLAETLASHRSSTAASENQALQALQRRAEALAHEVAGQREVLATAEEQAVAALEARFAALRAAVEDLGRDHETMMNVTRERMVAFEDSTGALGRALLEQTARLDAELAERRETAEELLADQSAALTQRLADLDAAIAGRRQAMAAAAAEAASDLAGRLADLDAAVGEQRGRQEADARLLGAQCEAMAEKVSALSILLRASGQEGEDAAAAMDRGLARLNQRLVDMRAALTGTDSQVATLTASAVRLLELIQAGGDHTRTQLPDALRTTEAGLGQIESRVSALRDSLREAGDSGRALSEHVGSARGDVAGALDDIARLHDDFVSRAAQQEARLGALRETLAAARRESDALSQDVDGRLSDAISRLSEAAVKAGVDLQESASGEIAALAGRLGEEMQGAIMRVLQGRGAELVARLEEAIDSAAAASRETAIQMRDQLAKVDELAGNLESRVNRARERAEEQVDNDFARRTALITESLNSTAIDIAKVLSADVSETAWASYLRGDRGIFTRRAVSLLDNAEARAVQQHYESDAEFREHVNRYIHDFEAMLRQLLSTRDGNALGVTLLSSDMGKLYVALAQGIERLRT